jgi:hypothetical protein
MIPLCFAPPAAFNWRLTTPRARLVWKGKTDPGALFEGNETPLAALRSPQSPKKIAGLNNAGIPEGFHLSQMVIAGHDQVRPAGECAFQNTVVYGVFAYHLQADRWADNLRNLSHEFQVCHDVSFLPVQNIAENVCDFPQDCRDTSKMKLRRQPSAKSETAGPEGG